MEEQPGAGSGWTPEIRVSEAERDTAAAALAKYCGEGRLTLEEFSQRVEQVLAARTQSDLDRVMADLPKGDVVEAYASSIPPSGWQVSILSGSSKKGRWRPKPRMKALAIMGGIELDFRNAEIEGREVTITAFAIMGGIDIVVPEGVHVHLGGFSIMGGRDMKVSNAPVLPGAPVIKVRAFPIMGGISVRTKRPRAKVIEDVRQAFSPTDLAASLRWGGKAVDKAVARTAAAGRPPNRHQTLDARDALALAGEILDRLSGRAAPGGRPPGSPNYRSPAAPDGTVTILFCDVSGFTEMTERFGDVESQNLLATYFGIVRERSAAHGGYEVKCQGDEAMLAFAGAGQAVRCAIDIQRALGAYNATRPDAAIRAHLGLHTGEAIQDGGDFLGRTVILASRITDEAQAEEILVSSLLHELTANSQDLVFGAPRTATLQGVSDSQQLYPVLWD